MKYLKFICVFLFLSCSKSQEPKILQNFHENNYITIDGSHIPDTTDISDIIDSIRIIKIKETEEGMFGGIEKLLYANEKYVIFDPHFSKKIIIFDKEGIFYKNLVKMGSGPEEMSKLSDLWLNDGKYLGVYDNYLKKIIIYDENFKVAEEMILRNSNYFGSLFKIHNKNSYIAYSGYNGFLKDNQFFKVASLDSALNLKDVFLPYPNILNQALISTPISPFFVHRDTIVFTQNFDPNVYNISQTGNLFVKYKLKYITNPLPSNFEKEIIEPNIRLFKSEMLDFEAIKKLFSGYTGFRGPWLETSKYTIFNSFDLKYSTFISVYSKEQKEIIYQGKNFSETVQYHMQIPSYFYATESSENRFISIFEGYNVLLLLKESSPFFEMVKNDIESYYILDISLK